MTQEHKKSLGFLRLPLSLDGFVSRKLIHIGVSLFFAVLSFHANPEYLMPLAGAACLVIFAIESVRLSTPVKEVINEAMDPILKNREKKQFTSVFWSSIAAFVGSAFGNPLAISYGFAVFALADPAAAVIGRQIKGPKLHQKKTLLGFFAFFLVASAITLFYLSFAHYIGNSYLAALAAGLMLATVELFSDKIDDNFSVLLSATLVMILLAGI